MPRADDPKINALSRYEKRSADLALLQYDHCEVPAGCGGAVLRWIDPRAAVPVQMWLYAPSVFEAFVDGAAPSSSRPLLGAGPHVLAVRVERVAPGGGALLFAARLDEAARLDPADEARLAGVKAQASFCSAPDPSWKVTGRSPDGDGWTREGFDDRRWLDAVEIALPEPEPRSSGSWRLRGLVEKGARPIGLREAEGPLWIRHRFTLDLVPSGGPR
jgi:hypothetical protein